MGKYYPSDHWFIDFDIWVAQWPWLKSQRSPFNNPNLPSIMRGDWSLYQYTDAADKKSFGSLDTDVFNGTVEDMRKWLDLDPIMPPVPPPPVVITPQPQPHEDWFGGAAKYHKVQTSIKRSDGLHSLTYHLVEIDLSRFEIVLDPKVAVASTTNFLARSKAQIAINGLDGFYSIKKGRFY